VNFYAEGINFLMVVPPAVTEVGPRPRRFLLAAFALAIIELGTQLSFVRYRTWTGAREPARLWEERLRPAGIALSAGGFVHRTF
jgi:hypothetical protein